MPIVLNVFVVLGMIAWLYAVWCALLFVQEIPAGQKLSAFFPGWPWNVEKAVARYGPQVEQPLRRFQKAFALFFAIVLLAVMVSFAFAFANNS